MATPERSRQNDKSRYEETINENSDQVSDTNEALLGNLNYPPSEDIMNPSNGFQKTDADDENLTSSGRYIKSGSRITSIENVSADEDYDDLGIVPGTEADVTAEDLKILGPREGDADMGDDELVTGKIQPVGHADEELDIPGAELDDEAESIGEEDEENNYYSLGGDRHEDLEEGKA